ncbi:MAG: hypothetical protein HUJ25_10525 [Crocinitomicaceae bacterium]|nr:hypothetical protein [Crocinitomicaceae bacterium]
MKLTFLNTIPKRVGFSLLLGASVYLATALFVENWEFDILSVLIYSVIAFIPVTLFYAIVSTFYSDTNDDEDVIDT